MHKNPKRTTLQQWFSQICSTLVPPCSRDLCEFLQVYLVIITGQPSITTVLVLQFLVLYSCLSCAYHTGNTEKLNFVFLHIWAVHNWCPAQYNWDITRHTSPPTLGYLVGPSKHVTLNLFWSKIGYQMANAFIVTLTMEWNPFYPFSSNLFWARHQRHVEAANP